MAGEGKFPQSSMRASEDFATNLHSIKYAYKTYAKPV
jgi:hypothetical protein